MMANGDALFFIMGDWELGALMSVGYEPGTDILCGQSPTDWGKPGFILNSDSVVFFKQNDPDYSRARSCSPRPDPVARSSRRCSTSPRARSRRASTSTCRRASTPASSSAQADLQASIEAGTLVRSMAHNMTVLQKYRGAMMDTITEFVNTPEMTSEEAANLMADAVEAQM